MEKWYPVQPIHGRDTDIDMPSLNSISDSTPTPRRIVWESFIYQAAELWCILMDAMLSKRTGQLTINFSNGTPSGTVEWKQKTFVPLDNLSLFPVESTVDSEIAANRIDRG